MVNKNKDLSTFFIWKRGIIPYSIKVPGSDLMLPEGEDTALWYKYDSFRLKSFDIDIYVKSGYENFKLDVITDTSITSLYEAYSNDCNTVNPKINDKFNAIDVYTVIIEEEKMLYVVGDLNAYVLDLCRKFSNIISKKYIVEENLTFQDFKNDYASVEAVYTIYDKFNIVVNTTIVKMFPLTQLILLDLYKELSNANITSESYQQKMLRLVYALVAYILITMDDPDILLENINSDGEQYEQFRSIGILGRNKIMEVPLVTLDNIKKYVPELLDENSIYYADSLETIMTKKTEDTNRIESFIRMLKDSL